MKQDVVAKALDGRADELVRNWRANYSGMDNDRAQLLPIWRDIRDFIAPRTARFQGEQVDSGIRQDLNIINTSPRLAVRILGSGMQSGVTSPIRPWFRLGTPDPDLQKKQNVKEWLWEVENVLREIMSRSNMYDRLKSTYMVEGTYGTSCLFVDEDPDDIIRAHDFPMGTFMLATSAAGRANQMYRDCTMTARQMMEKFKERCPEEVKLAYDRGNYTARFQVCHIVEDNQLYRPGSALKTQKKFASVYLYHGAAGDKAILDYQGYDYNPFFGPRWDVLGEDVYGTGCGEYALGDSKQLQLMEKRSLQILDAVARPNMLADASLRTQRVSNLPGETTYQNGLINGNAGYRPTYQISNPPIDLIDNKSQRVEARIDEAFYKNLFLLVTEIADQPNITATQINTMREEKLLQLGPVLERLNDELLDPLIDTVFNIAMSRGLLPPAPEELQGMALRVEYISVLAQAQKAMGIGNIERFIGFVGNYAQFDPGAINKLNTNEIIDQYGDGIAVPPRLIRTNEEVEAIAQQQAQQQQMAAAAEMAPKMAGAVKAMNDTQMGDDTALTRALGMTPE